MGPMRALRGPVVVLVVLAMFAAGCAGDGDDESSDGDGVAPQGEAAGSVEELDLFPVSSTGLDMERLAAAVATLDPDAVCPEPVLPASYQGHFEVGRIEGGCALVEYEPIGGRSIEEVVEALASDLTVFAVGVPAIDIRPDVLQSEVVYDDASLPQWHLKEMGVDKLWSSGGWVGPSDEQVRGWYASSGVTVAVIDDGVDGSHRDLAARVAPEGDSCHRNPFGDHGTHVAGIVAAEQGNSEDVAGVASNAWILPVKVHFDENYADWQNQTGPDDPGCHKIAPTLTQAINLSRRPGAGERGADVINMSVRWRNETDLAFIFEQEIERVGGSWFGLAEAFYEGLRKHKLGEDTLDWAIQVARLQGIVVVAAAGNCGDNQDRTIGGVTKPGFEHNDCNSHNQQQRPALYDDVITVAATDSSGNRASFSTSNTDVDVAAPGRGILSTVPLSTCVSEDADNDGTIDSWTPLGCGSSSPPTQCDFGTPPRTSIFDRPNQCAHSVAHQSGTSMAAPMVAAVVAHMKARYPEATVKQIVDALTETANNPQGAGKTNDYGHGIVDPVAALEHLASQFEDVERIPAVGAPDVGGPVSLAVGDSAQGQPGCSSQHCAHLQITLDASADDYQIECWSSLDSNEPWYSGTWQWPTSSLWSEGGCWFGFPGEQVWVTVDGIQSNTIIWPATSSSGAPGEVTGLAYDLATITAGWSHSCGLRTDDTIACWGNNEYGASDAPAGTFKAVTAGWIHSCGLRTDDTIACWGSNDFGESGAPAGTFKAVTAGDYHSCGLRTDDTIACWGADESGQTSAPAGTFKAVTAGDYHSCGLRTDDTIACWGGVEFGQTSAPAGTFKAVTAGFYHSCGLRTDDTIACWGADEFGQPSAPAGTFKAVTASGVHTCGLRTGDTIACWGADEFGQTDAPAGTFKAIATRVVHACGLRTGDTVACWGSNEFGQTDAPAGTFKAIVTGGEHSCGLRTDGTFVCWGNNEFGQTDAPPRTLGPADEGQRAVTVSKGRLGPTSLGAGEGVPCAPNTPTCRYLHVELSDFAPGEYTVKCSHDGWSSFGPSTWWTFSITVGDSGSASSQAPCFINFARLTGNGAYVTVTSPRTETVASNWIK